MKKEQFYVGQRVVQKDQQEDFWAYGHVKQIRDNRIVIQWNDITSPCDHFEDEWPTIFDRIPD